MDYKKSQIIAIILGILGLMFVLRDYVLHQGLMGKFFYIGWALLLGTFIIDHKYKRCPHCNAYLKKSPDESSICPKCGKKIFEK